MPNRRSVIAAVSATRSMASCSVAARTRRSASSGRYPLKQWLVQDTRATDARVIAPITVRRQTPRHRHSRDIKLPDVRTVAEKADVAITSRTARQRQAAPSASAMPPEFPADDRQLRGPIWQSRRGCGRSRCKSPRARRARRLRCTAISGDRLHALLNTKRLYLDAFAQSARQLQAVAPICRSLGTTGLRPVP